MHTVTFVIDQAAQRAAVLAGEPAERRQAFELPRDFLGEALELGATIDPDGEVSLDLCHTTLPVRPQDPKEALRAARWLSEQRAEAGHATQALFRTRAVALLQAIRDGEVSPNTYFSPAQVAILTPEEWGELQLRREEANKREAARAAEQKATWEQEAHKKRLKETNRLRWLALLAIENGPASVQERVRAGSAPLGLLPEQEAMRIVRDAYLPIDPEGGLWPFTAITPDEVCPQSNQVGFLVKLPSQVGGLTAEEWQQVQTIQTGLRNFEGPQTIPEKCHPESSRPLLSTRIVVHVGRCCDSQCPCSGGELQRVGVQADLNFGYGLTVSREYGGHQ